MNGVSNISVRWHRLYDKNTLILALVVAAWSSLFVWQGLDFIDMGYWFTAYRQFYSTPESVPSLAWLTCFIGHWCGYLSGGTILTYRLWGTGVDVLAAVMVYRILRIQFGDSLFLQASVFIAVMLSRLFGGNWIGYNELSGLFYVVAASTMYYGIVGNSNRLVGMAGIVAGANVFIRFPNVLGILLVFAIWGYAWIGSKTVRQAVWQTLCYICGFGMGGGLIYALIVWHGHDTILIHNLYSLFTKAADASSTHSATGLMRLFVGDYIRIFMHMGIFALFYCMAAVLLAWRRTRLTYGLVSLLGISFFLIRCHFMGAWRVCIPAFCFLSVACMISVEGRKNPDLAVLGFLSAMVLFLVPLGSNNGVTNAVFGLWLCVPISIGWLNQSSNSPLASTCLLHERICRLVCADQMKAANRAACNIAFFTFLLTGLLSAWTYTYMDSPNRFKMIYQIDHPLLHKTYTSEKRAKVVNELLHALSNKIRPGDPVLVYNGISMVYYLTQSRPWLGSLYPDYDTATKIKTAVQDKCATGAPLPVCIVRAKASTFARNWPEKEEPLVRFGNHVAVRDFLTEFEIANHYSVTWSNSFFDVLQRDETLDFRYK